MRARYAPPRRFSARSSQARRNRRKTILELESLETRDLPAGSWTSLASFPPEDFGLMLLLTDGTVMAQGSGVSKHWFKLTPDSAGSYINGTWSQLASMSLERLYGGTAVLPSGKVLYVGGEYTGSPYVLTETTSGEIYDPALDKWSSVAAYPAANFGDDSLELLANGLVLGSFNGGPQTNLYNPGTNTWSPGGTKLRGDSSSEEGWIKLGDGSLLTAEIDSSLASGSPSSQRYFPASNTWMDAGTIPVPLTDGNQEMGPGVLLPDGRAIQFGCTGNSAIYNPATNTWINGPKIPNGMVTDDAPGAILPNGHVIILADVSPLKSPSALFDYDPVANTITAMSVPGALSSELSSSQAFAAHMLVLPSGELMFAYGGGQIWDYNPGAPPQSAWRPTVSTVTFSPSGNVYTLTGTQLNGISEGASYGDDAQMASNYPIVRLTSSSGTVYWARTVNWTSALDTGSTPVTTQFTLPAGMPQGLYTLNVIANGIISAPFSLPVGLSVIDSTPANGATLASPPTSFSVTFQQPIDPGSLQPGDLMVNGVAATGATLNAADTVATFTFATNPVTTQGPQTMAIAAGAFTAQGNSTVVSAPFNVTFYFDTLPLAIASTSPAAGAAINPPTGNLTFSVNFNEPIDPSRVAPGNLTLSRGTVASASVLPGSQTVAYTISGLNSEGPLTITIAAGTLEDQYDNPASPSFAGTFYLDNGIMPLPAPTAAGPFGSLIYSTSASSVLQFAGDMDQFTLAADPGQTLSVQVLPSNSTFTPTVALADPSGTSLGSASSAGPGQGVVLQTLPTTTSGTYTITVAGAGGTLGSYTVVVTFDATVGAGNNSVATAQPLDGGFLSLGNGGSRAAAVSQAAAAAGYFNDFEHGLGGFTINNTSIGTGFSPGLWHLTTRRSTQAGHSPTTSFWYGNEATGTYNTNSGNGGSIISPVLTVPAGARLSFNYVLQDHGNGSLDFASVEISTDGFASFSTLLSSSSSFSLPVTSTWLPASVSLAAWSGQNVQIRWRFLSDNVTNNFEGWYVDDVSVQPPAPPPDYYSVQLNAGDRATFALKNQAGGGALTTMALEDARGFMLATTLNGGSNADEVISNYIAPATGLYYLHIDRGSSTGYGLVVTRNAAFDPKTNASFAAAQDLTGSSGALGALSGTTPDWYKVTLPGIQNGLLVQTSTPLGGPAQALNALDPTIQLFDSSDTLLASGTLLPDGRNQSLAAIGLKPGASYSIEVTSANGNPGEYFLAVSSPVQIATTSLANWTVNVAGYSQTINASSNSGASGPLTFTFTGTLPTGLLLNSSGVLTGTPTTPGSYAFTVIATDSLGVKSSANYVVTINPVVTITSTLLPNGTTGFAYSQTIATTGGTAPLAFSATGTLPPGLSLSSSGVLSGTPTATGSFAFTVTAMDSLGVSASQSYTLAILTITPTSLPAWTVGAGGFAQTFTAAGGSGSYTFSSIGTLPPGLTLSSGGVLSGTPVHAGTYTFTVFATDSTSLSAGQSYTLVINPALLITNITLANWTVSIPNYNQTLGTVGGTGTLTFSESGALPAGLTFSGAGVLSGKPTVVGSFSITMTVTDAVGATESQLFTLTINPVATFSPATLPPGTVNGPYNLTITTVGGTGNKHLIVDVSGTFIAGLSIPSGVTNSVTISGTPQNAGSATILVMATDATGAISSQTYTLLINPAIAFVTTLLPDDTVGIAYTQTLRASGGTGSVTFAAPGALPSGLTLSSSGVLAGTPTALGLYRFTVKATDTVGGTTSATFSININPTVMITTTTLAPWTVNQPTFNQTIAATGGTGTLTFAQTAGTLPAGQSLSSSGLLTGKPTAAGSYTFTVTATDQVGASASQTFTVVINPPVSIPSTTLPPWTVNQHGYSQMVSTAGGTGSKTFSSTGTLPPGLTLSSGGVLAGTPTTVSSFTFAVTAADITGSSASQNVTITINPALALSPSSLGADTVNTAYNQTIGVAGGTGMATLVVTGIANAITGLNVPASGTGTLPLTGTPTATGTESFTVTATDASGASASQDYTLVVNPPVAITTTSLAPGSVGQPVYNQTIVGTGGTGALTFSATGLSPGLMLTSDGVLSGTPAAAGSFSFTVTATDTVGATANQSFMVTINPAVAITTSSLAAWTVGVSGYSQSITATGGTGSLTFSTTGTLPTGLSLSSGGVLSGTPTVAGSYSINVIATDTLAASGSQTFTVTINPTIHFAPGVLASGLANVPYNKTISAIGGTGTITLTVSNITGAIPGITLPASATGTLSITGTPTATGTERFTLTGTDPLGSTFSSTYSLTINPSTVFLSIPSTGFAAAPGGTVLGFPISINELQDQQPTNHVGLASATFAVTFPKGVFAFPTGTNQATPEVHLGSVPLSDPVAPGGAADWALSATSPADGLLNVTLLANAGKKITTNNPASGGTLVLIDFPVSPSYNPTSPTAQTISLVSATGAQHTTITGNNGQYTLQPAPPYSGSITINPVPLQVLPGSVVGAASGFSLQFNAPYLVNAMTPVLYGSGFGPTAPVPSVTLTQVKDGSGNPVNQPVEGSLLLSTANNSITFLATSTALETDKGSPVLPDGSYLVVVRSSAATNGFQALNPGGGFLDGLGTGVPGSGDFTATFTVHTAGEDVVWAPDTAEGPGQALNAPGMNLAGGGYPIYLTDTSGAVTDVQVTFNYDPTLLSVTGVTGAGFTLSGSSTPGQAVLQYSGPALPSGNQTPIGFLSATVPSGTAGSPVPYRAKDLLHLTNVSLNGGTIPVTSSDALHLVAYVGDANGDGAYSSDDAARIIRAELQIDSGFSAYPLVDPVIVADTDGAGYLPPDAALQVNEAGVNVPTANLPFPAIPGGVVFQIASTPAAAPAPSAPRTSAQVVQALTPPSSADLGEEVDTLHQARSWRRGQSSSVHLQMVENTREMRTSGQRHSRP
jgi:hypothetical protein